MKRRVEPEFIEVRMRWLSFVFAVMLFTFAATAADRPNVVFIVSDDHCWNDYGFMGHKVVQTPHLDKLAAQSVTYTRGYVPTSLCRPSLMSMMTGLYPHQHKVTGNDPAPVGGGKDRGNPEYLKQVLKLDSFIDAVPTIPRLLGEAGYVSFQTGKWWEGNFKKGGFTDGMSDGDPTKGGRHGDAGLKIGRQTMQPMYDFMDKARAEKKPFFLWYAPMMPHDPHTPPQRLFDKYKDKVESEHVARYYAMVDWFDETCGELMAYLEKNGIAENTLVVYITDNGWIQNPDARSFAPGSKQSPNDGGVRTPVMLRWLGKVKPRMNQQNLASSVDLLPTIAAACGVKAPAGLPGINLLDEQAAAARKTVYGEIYTHDLNDLDRPAASLRYRWIIDGDDKLILPHGAGQSSWMQGVRPELYNLKSDPWETHNLYAAGHPRVKELTQKLNAWWPLAGGENAAPAGKAKGKGRTKKQ